MPLTCLLISFLLATGVSTALRVSSNSLAVGMFVGAVISLIYIKFSGKKSTTNLAVILAMIILGVSLGIWRSSAFQHDYEHRPLDMYAGQELEVSGVVVETPRLSGLSERSSMVVLGEKVVVVLPDDMPYGAVTYGDEFRGRATIELPERFVSPGGVDFDYPSYLRAQGIKYIVTFESGSVVSSHRGAILVERLYDFRNLLIGKIKMLLPEPEAGLLSGIILGDKSGLDKALKDALTRVGLIHIAVLSGSNIIIIALFVRWLCRLLPLRIQTIVTVSSIWLFIIMSGAEPPATRAGLLITIVLLGTAVFRRVDINRALLTIAAIMIWLSPFSLLWNVSFQLSFLATLGLVYVTPIVSSFIKLPKKVNKFSLQEIIAATIATQLTVLPIILYTSGTLSLVSVIANLLVVFVIPPLMLIGFVATIIGFMSSTIALPFTILSEYIAGYIVWVVRVLDAVPYSSVIVQIKSPMWVMIIYLVFFAFVIWWNYKQASKRLSQTV